LLVQQASTDSGVGLPEIKPRNQVMPVIQVVPEEGMTARDAQDSSELLHAGDGNPVVSNSGMSAQRQ